MDKDLAGLKANFMKFTKKIKDILKKSEGNDKWLGDKPQVSVRFLLGPRSAANKSCLILRRDRGVFR